MGKRYLVTGATGFVGSHLTRRLARNGEEVHILARPSSNPWRIADVLDRVKIHPVDLRDAAALETVVARIKPEIVYHLAAYGVRLSEHDPVLSAEINLTGTINLVQALMKTGYEQLIHTGSSAEYGIKNKPMFETDLLEPNTYYGVTKAAAGLFCQMMGRSRKQPILILRLLSPYGPYDEPNRLIPAVIAKCLAGRNPELSPGRESRSFFYMGDLIDLYLKVTEVPWPAGEIVNVGPSEHYSVRDIAMRIIRLTGAKVEPLFGALAPREFDTDFWLADTTKARTLFEWSPKVTIDEGLARTIEWHREARGKPELLETRMR
jgi:nucleoside-diphosphate-sugar epimerase